jgi:hypothetical protein
MNVLGFPSFTAAQIVELLYFASPHVRFFIQKLDGSLRRLSLFFTIAVRKTLL